MYKVIVMLIVVLEVVRIWIYSSSSSGGDGTSNSSGSLFIHIDLLYSFIMYVHDQPRRIVYRNSHCMHVCVSPRRI